MHSFAPNHIRQKSPYPILHQLYRQLYTDSSHGSMAVLMVYQILIGHGATLVSAFTGFLYPVYSSVRMIEGKDEEGAKKWLAYWVVYASFSFCEYLCGTFLEWFMMYYLFKVCFLVWCLLPIENNGSMIIYNQVIKPLPLFRNSEAAVDINALRVKKILQDSLFEKDKLQQKYEAVKVSNKAQ
ncbi:receptor expression-enhancing protein 5-like isoform X2 [Gordionus sp. m RMFG-2023]|uniref:receptor expression-enhancing protein 5-like isoform X2 n=1 Tax=Gordionus sp. m RMFG-2023 TaxID=3053472 RepID=UPI0031FCD3CF